MFLEYIILNKIMFREIISTWKSMCCIIIEAVFIQYNIKI